jgi:hypothetical protein
MYSFAIRAENEDNSAKAGNKYPTRPDTDRARAAGTTKKFRYYGKSEGCGVDFIP